MVSPAPLAPPASGSPPPDSTASSATAITGTTPAVAVSSASPNPAPGVVDPTAHLQAIRAQLSPDEAAIAKTMALRMAPEERVQWIVHLSTLSIDQAVALVRSKIPKTSATTSLLAKHDATDSNHEGAGRSSSPSGSGDKGKARP